MFVKGSHALGSAATRLRRDKKHTHKVVDGVPEPRPPKSQMKSHVQGEETFAETTGSIHQRQGSPL